MISRKQAYKIADEYIPNVWGALREAWVNGFNGVPQRGVARYPKDSACAEFRKRGVKARQDYEWRIHHEP